jgi:hypothetical protein
LLSLLDQRDIEFIKTINVVCLILRYMTNNRLPVRIEILSSAENVSSLDSDLREILVDSSDSCEYTAYVDKDGITQIKIECIISEEEKQGAWNQLRIKHAKDCSLSAEPIWLPDTKTSMHTNDLN